MREANLQSAQVVQGGAAWLQERGQEIGSPQRLLRGSGSQSSPSCEALWAQWWLRASPTPSPRGQASCLLGWVTVTRSPSPPSRLQAALPVCDFRRDANTLDLCWRFPEMPVREGLRWSAGDTARVTSPFPTDGVSPVQGEVSSPEAHLLAALPMTRAQEPRRRLSGENFIDS